MKRVYLALALVAGIAGTVTVGVDAQTKKDSVKKDSTKKVETKKEGPAIEIYEGKNGFRYRVVDADGYTIAMPPSSKSWETRAQVIKAIGELREVLAKAKPVDVKE